MPEPEGTEEPRSLGEVVDILLDMQRRLREGDPAAAPQPERAETGTDGAGLRGARKLEQEPAPGRMAVRDAGDLVDLTDAERKGRNLGFPPPRPKARAPARERVAPQPTRSPETSTPSPEPSVPPAPPEPAGRDAGSFDSRVAALDGVLQRRPSARRTQPPAGPEEPQLVDGTPTADPARSLTLGERLAAEVAQELGVAGPVVIPQAEAPKPWEGEERGRGPEETPSIDVRLFRMEKELKSIFEEVKKDKVRLLQLDGVLTEWVEKVRSVLIKRFS